MLDFRRLNTESETFRQIKENIYLNIKENMYEYYTGVETTIMSFCYLLQRNSSAYPIFFIIKIYNVQKIVQ